MKVATRKMRSPLKTFGGKSYLARRIVSLFPEHETYVEPFVGGGSVLLNKPRGGREIAGDLDSRLIEFWSVLQEDLHDFGDQLSEVIYSRAIFESSVLMLDSPNRVHRALAFLVRNRMSRGGMGRDFAWSDRLRGGQPGDVNAWDTIRDGMPAITDRVSDVEFHCCDAVQLIKSADGPGTLFYCDPPYLHATRTHRKAYAHEMTDKDHERLLAALLGCKGKVFISGYDNPLYRKMLSGWKLHVFSMANHSGQGKVKQRRIECLWENPS